MQTFILPALLCWLAMLVVYLLAPLAAYTASKDGRLHWLFWWMETHDNLGWSGPLSEGYPADKWGLCRWLWRNKAYALRDKFRANPSEDDLLFSYEEVILPVPAGGFFKEHYIVGQWWERSYGYAFKRFKIYIRIGWKLKPYIDGHRPVGPTATGMLIPFSIRTDDFDD